MPEPPAATMGAVTRNISLSSILPRTPAPAQESQARSPEQLSLFPETAAIIPITPCPKCGSERGVQAPGKGPHYAAIYCISGHFHRWLSKPKSGGAA